MANNNSTLRTLATRRDFLELKSKGKKIRAAPWLLVTVLHRQDQGSRFGWIVPRYVGTAVIRNRLKRWLRIYLRDRLKSGERCNGDIGFVFQKPSNPDVYRKLRHADFIAAVDSAWGRIPVNYFKTESIDAKRT